MALSRILKKSFWHFHFAIHFAGIRRASIDNLIQMNILRIHGRNKLYSSSSFLSLSWTFPLTFSLSATFPLTSVFCLPRFFCSFWGHKLLSILLSQNNYNPKRGFMASQAPAFRGSIELCSVKLKSRIKSDHEEKVNGYINCDHWEKIWPGVLVKVLIRALVLHNPAQLVEPCFSEPKFRGRELIKSTTVNITIKQRKNYKLWTQFFNFDNNMRKNRNSLKSQF